MTLLVIALFVVQILVGLYQMGYVLGAGQRLSNARATRLPDPVVLAHPLAAVAAAGLWIVYWASDERWVAWATLAVLVGAAAGGALMFVRTVPRAPVVDAPGDEPADVRVAEKQIPMVSLVVHGLLALALIACVLLVALGVA